MKAGGAAVMIPNTRMSICTVVVHVSNNVTGGTTVLCWQCGNWMGNCFCRVARDFHKTVTNFTDSLREYVDSAYLAPEGRHSRRWQRSARWRACKWGVPLFRGLEPPRDPGAPDVDAPPPPAPRRPCSVRAAPRGRHHSPIWAC